MIQQDVFKYKSGMSIKNLIVLLSLYFSQTDTVIAMPIITFDDIYGYTDSEQIIGIGYIQKHPFHFDTLER